MAKGAISEQEVSSYRQDGYVLVRNMLDAEETELLGRAAREDRVLDQHSYGRADGEGGSVRLSVWNHPTDTIYGTVARIMMLFRHVEPRRTFSIAAKMKWSRHRCAATILNWECNGSTKLCPAVAFRRY